MFIYVLLVVLMLVFSGQVLNDVSLSSRLTRTVIIPIAIALPIFLLVMIGLNILRLIREHASGKPGARFKFRLILFFVLITALASVPQGLLSINFINTAMDSWFSASFGNALRGGLHIALEYNHDKVENLQATTQSGLVEAILRNSEANPDRTWRNLQEANPEIHGVQVFRADGSQVLFRGDARTETRFERIAAAGTGLLPRDSTYDVSILRSLKKYTLDGEEHLAVFSIVLPPEFEREAQQLTTSLEMFSQLDHFRDAFRVAVVVFYVFFSFPILLLSIMISFILSEEIIRPIVNLEEATRRVAEGDFSFRILSRSGDELSLLVSSFNGMVSELERSRLKIMQTEKITAWQEIAQQLAHEIKNPLTPIKLSAQRILRKYQNAPDELGDVLEPGVQSIIREVDSLNHLLQEFRDFARLPNPQRDLVNLRELVGEVAAAYEHSAPDLTIQTDGIDENMMVNADPKQLKQVFGNLFKNAMEAMDRKGQVFVRADLVKKGNSNYSRIQVQDTGPGIHKDSYDKVFNPYFTTKRDGTGLGLSIVERIVFDHKGQIWFETQQGVGTTFFIDIPLET